MGDEWHILASEFNSVQHRTQTREHLYNMSIDTVSKEKNCSLVEALEHVHMHILDRIPQCGPDYQKDFHLCDFLYLAVRGQKWAREVLADRGFGGYGKESMRYSTFHHRLNAAASIYQLEEDQEGKEYFSGTYFGDTYANPRPKRAFHPRDRRPSDSTLRSSLRPTNRIKGKLSTAQLADLKKRTKCSHCHRHGHWRMECPDWVKTPVTEIVQARIRQLGNNDKAAAAVLWEMTQEEEKYEASHVLRDF